jgi:hypothetical protein
VNVDGFTLSITYGDGNAGFAVSVTTGPSLSMRMIFVAGMLPPLMIATALTS